MNYTGRYTLIVPIVATLPARQTVVRQPSDRARYDPNRSAGPNSAGRRRHVGGGQNAVRDRENKRRDVENNLPAGDRIFVCNIYLDMTTRHHLEVAAATVAMPLDRTISLNVHNRHGGGGGGGGGGNGAATSARTTSSQSSLKDRWYSFRYRPRGGTGNSSGDRQRQQSNVEEFLFMESLPDAPATDSASATEADRAPDGQEIELSIIIRKDTIRRDLMDSMRMCNGRLQLMELVELNEFDPGGVLPAPNQNELDRLFCWAIYVGAPAECLDSLYDCGSNLHYSHCGNFTAIHLAAFMGNADALRYDFIILQ